MAGYIDWAKVSGALVVMGVGTPARRCVDGRDLARVEAAGYRVRFASPAEAAADKSLRYGQREAAEDERIRRARNG